MKQRNQKQQAARAMRVAGAAKYLRRISKKAHGLYKSQLSLDRFFDGFMKKSQELGEVLEAGRQANVRLSALWLAAGITKPEAESVSTEKVVGKGILAQTDSYKPVHNDDIIPTGCGHLTKLLSGDIRRGELFVLGSHTPRRIPIIVAADGSVKNLEEIAFPIVVDLEGKMNDMFETASKGLTILEDVDSTIVSKMAAINSQRLGRLKVPLPGGEIEELDTGDGIIQRRPMLVRDISAIHSTDPITQNNDGWRRAVIGTRLTETMIRVKPGSILGNGVKGACYADSEGFVRDLRDEWKDHRGTYRDQDGAVRDVRDIDYLSIVNSTTSPQAEAMYQELIGMDPATNNEEEKKGE